MNFKTVKEYIKKLPFLKCHYERLQASGQLALPNQQTCAQAFAHISP